MMGSLEWKAYLQECSRQIIEDRDMVQNPLIPEAVVEMGWLGYEGATSNAIQQTEARLGVTLPPSLDAFYLVSNGWRTVGCFVWEVLPLEKIGWLPETDPVLYQVIGGNESPTEVAPEDDPQEEDENDYEQTTRVKRSLVLSTQGDASTWLLDPGTINDQGEWASGRWSAWNPAMDWIADSFEGLFQDEYETYLRLRAND